MKSALTAVPAMAIQAVEPNGTIPFLVKNNGTVSSPAVVLRLTASSGASRSSLGQGNEIRFGEIPPGEERVAYLTVVPDEGATRVEFQWELQDLSRQIHVGELSLDIASPVDVSVEPTLRSVPGRLTRISYDSSGAAGVWVFHPLPGNKCRYARASLRYFRWKWNRECPNETGGANVGYGLVRYSFCYQKRKYGF